MNLGLKLCLILAGNGVVVMCQARIRVSVSRYFFEILDFDSLAHSV